MQVRSVMDLKFDWVAPVDAIVSEVSPLSDMKKIF
jgi:hypothetical protein